MPDVTLVSNTSEHTNNIRMVSPQFVIEGILTPIVGISGFLGNLVSVKVLVSITR